MKTKSLKTMRKNLLHVLLFAISMCFINAAWACKASFTATNGTGGQVTFTSTSTGTNATTVYYWYPGDGNNAGGTGMTTYNHTYAFNGTYNAMLEIYDSVGCYDTVSIPVTITNARTCSVNANFIFTIGSNGLVAFTNTSTGTDASATYTWDFGDGNYSYTSAANNTYAYNGTYYCTLTINDSGCTSSHSDSIVITNDSMNTCKLTASFTYSISSNGLVTYNSTSTGITGNTYYYWLPGDGTSWIYSGYTASSSHTYPKNGTYVTELYLGDSITGCYSTAYDTIVITNDSVPLCNLHAAFTVSIGTGGQVTFTSTSTGVNSDTWYDWDQNAGDPDYGLYGYGDTSFTYIYPSNGTYTAGLFLQDSSGMCTDSISVTFTITNDSVTTCALNPSYTDSLMNNGEVYFYSTSTGVTANTVYSWDPGDGSGYTSGTGMTTFAHNYLYNGTYYATLYLYDSTLGCSNSVSSYLTITTDTAYNPYDTCLYANFTDTVYYVDSLGHIDSVSFYSISDTLCNDSSHRAFKSSSHIPIVYSWDFGDGQQISGIGMNHSNHAYAKNGIYTVTLTINHNGSKSKSTSTRVVNVSPAGIITINNPNADFKLFPNPNNGIFRLAISGIDGNQNAELQITNLLGEVVYTTTTHSSNGMILQDVNLSNISAGTYFVRIVTPDYVYNTKAVINR